jgi:hypothetical protein
MAVRWDVPEPAAAIGSVVDLRPEEANRFL